MAKPLPECGVPGQQWLSPRSESVRRQEPPDGFTSDTRHSGVLSTDGRKNPVVTVAAEGIVGLELLIDPETRTVQFYAITSAVKGCGRRMVAAVVTATPPDWQLVVVMDWSGGFWQRMAEEYPRLVIF